MSDALNSHVCPECGSAFEPSNDLRQLCPRCVMQRVIYGSQDAETGSTVDSRPRFEVPETDDLQPLFPQFSDISLLGVGGMGAVYRAQQTSLDRTIALKILPRESGADPAFAERFAREAKALASLSHPNIVALHDFGESGGYFYFVMEFIEGVTLRDAIRRKTMSPQEAVRVVPEICEALQFAHDQGIVHRDIKPENILLSKDGRVKIADFGLAKLLAVPEMQLPLTASRHIVGTPHYMAPEQMERPLEVDHRADIFSLGVVFYELLTGELPIGRFDPPSQRVTIDVRLDEVVLRTLEKDPSRRYQHVGDVRTEVDQISSTPPPGTHVQLRQKVRNAGDWVRGHWHPGDAVRPVATKAGNVTVQFFDFVTRLGRWCTDRVSSVWDRSHPGELLVALATTIGFVCGVITIMNSRGRDETIFIAITLCGLGLIFSRCVMGRVESEEKLRPAQWLVLPILTLGYCALLSLILIWPAVATGLLAAAPALLEIDGTWRFLGEDFVRLNSDRLPKYWSLVMFVCFASSGVWWFALSSLAKIWPRPFTVAFHPCNSTHIRTAATYLFLLAIFGLGPIAGVLWALTLYY